MGEAGAGPAACAGWGRAPPLPPLQISSSSQPVAPGTTSPSRSRSWTRSRSGAPLAMGFCPPAAVLVQVPLGGQHHGEHPGADSTAPKRGARTPPHTLLAAPQEDGGPNSPPNPAAVSAEPVAQSCSGAQGLAGWMRNAPGRRGQSLCWPPAPNPGLLEHQTPASSESRARRQPSARPAGRKQMPRARSRRFPSLSGGAERFAGSRGCGIASCPGTTAPTPAQPLLPWHHADISF